MSYSLASPSSDKRISFFSVAYFFCAGRPMKMTIAIAATLKIGAKIYSGRSSTAQMSSAATKRMFERRVFRMVFFRRLTSVIRSPVVVLLMFLSPFQIFMNMNQVTAPLSFDLILLSRRLSSPATRINNILCRQVIMVNRNMACGSPYHTAAIKVHSTK